MPVSSEWYDEEQTIIHSTIKKPWTWDEYMDGIDEILAMLNQIKHPVVNIADYTEAGSAPPGVISRLPEIASLNRHPNLEYFVIFGISSRMGRTATYIFEQVYGKLFFADNFEEALALVQEHRGEANV